MIRSLVGAVGLAVVICKDGDAEGMSVPLVRIPVVDVGFSVGSAVAVKDTVSATSVGTSEGSSEGISEGNVERGVNVGVSVAGLAVGVLVTGDGVVPGIMV